MNDTDRELLEMAAKAAGIPLKPDFKERFDYYIADKMMWNPLTDDGDALRLAMRLRIWPDYYGCSESTPAHASAHYKSIKGLRASRRWIVEDYVPEEMFFSSFLPDRSQAAYQLEQGLIRGFEAAQRRAIVRAAAEIGKEMK